MWDVHVADHTLTVVTLSDVVRNVADTRAVRWWLEAELSALVPAWAVDATTTAIGELMIAACAPGHPANVSVHVGEDELRVDVHCDADDTPDIDELSRSLLAGSVDVWGMRVVSGRAHLWATLILL
jgi:hypothetical protein